MRSVRGHGRTERVQPLGRADACLRVDRPAPARRCSRRGTVAATHRRAVGRRRGGARPPTGWGCGGPRPPAGWGCRVPMCRRLGAADRREWPAAGHAELARRIVGGAAPRARNHRPPPNGTGTPPAKRASGSIALPPRSAKPVRGAPPRPNPRRRCAPRGRGRDSANPRGRRAPGTPRRAQRPGRGAGSRAMRPARPAPMLTDPWRP